MTVYTTRCDTLFGVTYMVLSPEHPFLNQWKDRITNWDEVSAYIDGASRKSDLERTDLNKDKTGVRLGGIEAVNPVNNTTIPVFVSDYVLMGYGTGAVMKDVQQELGDGLDAVSEDLEDVEDLIYDEDEDSDEDEDEDDDEDCYATTCPSCEETIYFDDSVLEEGEVVCPNCGERLEFDTSDIEDETSGPSDET